MDQILKYAVVVAPLALVLGGASRAIRLFIRWLNGPEAVQWKLRKRSGWVAIADEFERLGDVNRAEGYREIGDRVLARWAARGDLQREWRARGVLIIVAFEVAAVTVFAMLVTTVAPPGPRAWASHVAGIGLMLVGLLGIALLVIEHFWFGPAVSNSADDYAARLRVSSLGEARESSQLECAVPEVADAESQAPITAANVGGSFRGERMPRTPRGRRLEGEASRLLHQGGAVRAEREDRSARRAATQSTALNQ